MSFDYLLNDPSTPELQIPVENPPLPPSHPPFTVNGFNGVDGDLQPAQVYTSVAYVFDFVQKSFYNALGPWPGTNNLTFVPNAGTGLNAYYDRKSIQFFSKLNPSTNITTSACMSADVVAHEQGHGILDIIRPDLWNVASIEIMSFHESFGDMISILKALQHDEMNARMLEETKGNLTQPNIIANSSEEMGSQLYPQHPTYLRSATNTFKYTVPERLPVSAPDDQLSREPHSFSRVFTGTFWEIFTKIFERYKETGELTSVHTARDIMARLLLNAMPLAALNVRFYKAVAKAMLIVDKNLHNSENSDILQNVFMSRNISTDVQFLSVTQNLGQVTIPAGLEERIGLERVIRSGKVRNLKLRGRAELVRPIDNPLYDAIAVIPLEDMIHVDAQGNKLGGLRAYIRSAIRSVQAALDYLHLQKDTTFGIIDGKLERLRSERVFL